MRSFVEAVSKHGSDAAAASSAKDLDPLAALYHEHFEIVWRGLRRLGVPIASVDDATQDVFMVVHRRLHEFEARSSIRSWIFGIAVHVARYYRRKAGREAHDETEITLADPNCTSPERHAEDREALRLVYEVLDRLSEAHREVFVMADVEEMTAKKIAELLRIPENTVYSRLRHARANFESTLAELQRQARRTR